MLAPMAGVNDIAFRELCVECGAQLTYTEMVSSKGLDYNNEKTKSLLRLAPNEKRVVVQLFGHEPEVMARQAEYVRDTLKERLAYVDINMGCPARKIVKKGDGSALTDNPKLAYDIVKACNEVTPTSVKFRKHDNILKFAEAMQNAGAYKLCVHGRTREQFYKGKADWDIIAKVKENSSVPVIGSGDVDSYDSAKAKLEICDAVMIGRAAQGNPGVFSQKPVDRIALAKKHVIRYNEIYGGNLSHMRKHCIWYVKGMPGAKYAREAFSKCVSLDDFMEVLNDKRLQSN